MNKVGFFTRLKVVYKKYFPLISVLMMGLVAASLGWYYLTSSESNTAALLQKRAEVAKKNVVVPTLLLKAGTAVTHEMIAMRPVPLEFVHKDAVTPDNFDNFVGRELTVDVEPGRPLLAAFFSPKRKVFSEQIETGVRAITIPVDEISSISGLLRAGDRIDFMFVGEQKNENESGYVVPLLQDVLVRATGKITAEEFAATRKQTAPSAADDPYMKQSFSTVTVGLQPKDAQKLILAQRMGKIIAALRNPVDRETLTKGTNTADLNNAINSLRPERSIDPMSSSATQTVASLDVEYIIGGAGSIQATNNNQISSSQRDMILQRLSQMQNRGVPSQASPIKPNAQ